MMRRVSRERADLAELAKCSGRPAAKPDQAQITNTGVWWFTGLVKRKISHTNKWA